MEVLPTKYVDRRNIRGTYVRLDDGQLVEVEVDNQGNYIPVTLVQSQKQTTVTESVLAQGEEQAQQMQSAYGGGEPIEPINPVSEDGQARNTVMQNYLRRTMQQMKEKIERNPSSGGGQVVKGGKGISVRTLLQSSTPEDSDAAEAARMIEEQMKQSLDPNNYLHSEIRDESILKDPAFRARIQSVMTDNKYDRRVRNRKRGKLDMRRLWKVNTGSTSVFTQKEARKGKNYNIVLCVDESGSMAGSDIKRAAEAALYINEAFKGANINLAILGFNHFLVLHKDFDEEIENNQNMFTQIVGRANGYGSGCTHDYDALNKSYAMLAKQNARNGGEGMVMLLCDGSPGACGGDPHLYEPTPLNEEEKQQAHHFQALVKKNETVASAIGIGIGVEAWQIPDNIKINDVNDLRQTLVQVIRKKVKRG